VLSTLRRASDLRGLKRGPCDEPDKLLRARPRSQELVAHYLRDRRLVRILDLIGEHSLRRLREMLELFSPLGEEDFR